MVTEERVREIRQQAKAEVKERLKESQSRPPPPKLNLEDGDMLQSLNIMPKPRHNAALISLWQQMLAPNKQRIQPVKFDDIALDANHRIAKPRGALARQVKPRSTGLTRLGSSTNWSGAYVVASRYRRFTFVAASWDVPRVEPPATPIDDTYQVAIWVGLDGSLQRSRSLPQVGTTQNVVVRNGVAETPLCTVWFQWWLRDQLNPPVTLVSRKYPVKQDDRIVSMLAVDSDKNHVLVLIANLTEGWTAPLRYDGMNPAGLSVEGSTAEWIVERPTRLDPPYSLYPLLKFPEVHFRDCATNQAHDPPLGDPGDLTGARRVRMPLDVIRPPHRSAIISRPKELSASCLEVVYRDP